MLIAGLLGGGAPAQQPECQSSTGSKCGWLGGCADYKGAAVCDSGRCVCKAIDR